MLWPKCMGIIYTVLVITSKHYLYSIGTMEHKYLTIPKPIQKLLCYNNHSIIFH